MTIIIVIITIMILIMIIVDDLHAPRRLNYNIKMDHTSKSTKVL